MCAAWMDRVNSLKRTTVANKKYSRKKGETPKKEEAEEKAEKEENRFLVCARLNGGVTEYVKT